MPDNEHESREEPVGAGERLDGTTIDGEVATLPPPVLGPVNGVPGPPSYWQAVISTLPAGKQAAAWQFFQERELGCAPGATDTLSGLLLLLEANGLFMDACARRLAVVDARLAGQPATVPVDVSTGAVLPDPPAASLAPSPARSSASIKNALAVWGSAVLLALMVGGLGAYLAERRAQAAADLRVKEQVRQIRTWLDVDEQARAILMSRKAELAFGFARDPSLGNRKVYTLTIKGASILRAGKTKEGAGVIAFDAGAPDLPP